MRDVDPAEVRRLVREAVDRALGPQPAGGGEVREATGPASRRVAVGSDHVCALGKDGTVWCWGNNKDGQVGDGTNERRAKPVKVALP